MSDQFTAWQLILNGDATLFGKMEFPSSRLKHRVDHVDHAYWRSRSPQGKRACDLCRLLQTVRRR